MLGGVAFVISALILTILNLYLSGHNIRILSNDLPVIMWSLSDLLSITVAVFTVIMFFKIFLKREKVVDNNFDKISNTK